MEDREREIETYRHRERGGEKSTHVNVGYYKCAAIKITV